MNIHVKRVYEKPNSTDGKRILVDRIWPRGVSKEEAHLDLWVKGLAPSTELRKWFNHDPAKWKEFQSRYLKEIQNSQEAQDDLDAIMEFTKTGKVTLLFAAKDEAHNNAIVLLDYLKKHP